MNGSQSRLTLWGAMGVLAAAASVLAYVLILALRPGQAVSIERAREQMRHQWFHKAIDTLTALLEKNDNDFNATLARGVCYVRTGQHGKAREDFERALRLKPGDPAAQLGLAEVLWSEAQYEAALDAAQALANAHPNFLPAFTLVGKAHYKLFEREARECVRILEDRPRSATTLAAASEVRLGRFDSSETCWTEWHNTDPAAAAASKLREHLDAAKRHFGLALENLRTASGPADARPGTGDPEAWLLLAALLLEQGDDTAAEAAADRALALGGPDHVQAVLVKAEAISSRAARLMQEGAAAADAAKTAQADALNTQAIRLLEDLIQAAPAAVAAKDKLAILYVRAGRIEEAGELAQKSAKESRSVKARYVKAIVHLAREEFDEAATEFLSVRNELASEPRLYFGLGLAYYRRGGDTASAALAIQQFRRVVDLRPNFVPARVRLARLYLQQGWFEEARKECEQILATPGRPLRLDPQIYLLLSEAYRGLKQYDQVLQILHKAAEETPSASALLTQEAVRIQLGMEHEVIGKYSQDKTNPTYLCIVGQALLKKGNRDEAMKQFRRAVDVDPQFIMAYVYLASAHESAGEYAEAAAQYERAIRMIADLRLPRNRSIHFGLGLVRIKQGRFAEAEEQFKTVLDIARQERTDHPAARLRLAALELRKPEPNFERALSEVSSVIRHSETADARFLAGLIHSAAARRPAELIRAEIRAMRSGDPSRRGLEVTDADVESRRHVSWDNAVKEYERAIELDPRFLFSYEVALIYAMQRRFDHMAAVCQRALDVSPTSAKPQLLRWLAVARLGLRDASRALDAAREAVRLSLESGTPDHADVLHGQFILVNCRIATGDLDEARAELHRVAGVAVGLRETLGAMIDRLDLAAREAAISGNSAPARLRETIGLELNLAMLFSRAGIVWLPEAERSYLGVLRKDTENIVALRYLGDLYIVMGEYAKAEDVNRRLLKVLPNFALALRNLAAIEDLRTRAIAAAKETTQERLDAQQEAIRLYESAAQAAPDFWLPRLELGALYQRAGANDKAMALYEQVIALNPQHVQALNDYANLCAEEKKNLDKAIEYARKAKELSPFDGAVADTLGVLHTLLGQPDAAVEQLEQARYLLPSHPTVRYHLAVAYDQTGKKEKALALLDELLESDAKFPERAEAEALRGRLRRP